MQYLDCLKQTHSVLKKVQEANFCEEINEQIERIEKLLNKNVSWKTSDHVSIRNAMHHKIFYLLTKIISKPTKEFAEKVNLFLYNRADSLSDYLCEYTLSDRIYVVIFSSRIESKKTSVFSGVQLLPIPFQESKIISYSTNSSTNPSIEQKMEQEKSAACNGKCTKKRRQSTDFDTLVNYACSVHA